MKVSICLQLFSLSTRISACASLSRKNRAVYAQTDATSSSVQSSVAFDPLVIRRRFIGLEARATHTHTSATDSQREAGVSALEPADEAFVITSELLRHS